MMSAIKAYINRLSNERSYYHLQTLRGKRYREIINLDLAEKRVIEVGCGYGGIVSALDAATSVGIDIDKKLIRRASILTDNPHAVFTVGDATRMPYINESFDVILLLDVIEHVGNPEELIRESVRVLKKDGLLCVNFASYKTAFGGHLILPYIHYLPRSVAYFIVEMLIARIKTPDNIEMLDMGRVKRQHEMLNPVTTRSVSQMLKKYFTMETESATMVIPYMKVSRFAALIPDFLCVSRFYICRKK